MVRGRVAVRAVVLLALMTVLAACGGGTPSGSPVAATFTALPSGTADASEPPPAPTTVPVTASTTTPATTPVTAAPSSPASSLGSGATVPASTPPSPTITIPVLPTPLDQGPVEGADVSWPQCPKGMGIPQKRSEGAPMPLRSARFVVLGLTNGPGFYPNPCLADQVAWAAQRHLLAGAYAVVSYPEKQDLLQYGGQGPYDPGTRLGRLANVGYQQALFNVRTMQGAGLEVPAVWVDVEPVTGFDWSASTGDNAAVVRGAAKGYADQGLTVGVYSTISLWQRVVGDLRLGLPEWRAAGETSRAEALRRCGPERMFQGGTAVLTQWVQGGRDRDVTCPGGSTYLSLWLHQY